MIDPCHKHLKQIMKINLLLPTTNNVSSKSCNWIYSIDCHTSQWIHVPCGYSSLYRHQQMQGQGYFNWNGDVQAPTHEWARVQTSLQDEDIQVQKHIFIILNIPVVTASFDILSSTPDLYLDELWLELQETCGANVLISTIWRTLVKGGYTMKKAHFSLSLDHHIIKLTFINFLMLHLSAVLWSE